MTPGMGYPGMVLLLAGCGPPEGACQPDAPIREEPELARAEPLLEGRSGLRDAFWVSANSGIAGVVVGNEGLLLHDLGFGWRTVEVGVDADLVAVTGFRNLETDGWVVVGDGCTILRSDDAESWSPVDLDCTNDLTDVASMLLTVVAVGPQVALRSTDGGATWSPLPLSGGRAVAARGSSNGLEFVVVGDEATAQVSLDGGETWTPTPLEADQPLTDVTYGWPGQGWDGWPADIVLVAVGADGLQMASAPDAATWSPWPGPDGAPVTTVSNGWAATADGALFFAGTDGWVREPALTGVTRLRNRDAEIIKATQAGALAATVVTDTSVWEVYRGFEFKAGGCEG